ncbi:hypothetical protein A9Q81_03430 [Gammaproteobacteria bacterium 42_54_T18]|nr:hypothetical protein A9Q81_03430 [Gammaproteobacteria bacterium 42_54_T18]
MKMFTHTVVSDTVEINAPIELVWEILVDIAQYPHWNPFTVKIEGNLKVGNALDLHVNMPKRGDRVQTEIVEKIDAPHCLSWGMTLGLSPLLSALREQKLESISINRCSYVTSDRFSGLLSPLVYFLFYDDVYGGFNRVAYALKNKAEIAWKNQNYGDQHMRDMNKNTLLTSQNGN